MNESLLPELAMTPEEFGELSGLVRELADPSFLRNSADGKDVVLSVEDRQDLLRLVRELEAERRSRRDAWEAAGTRASECLALRTRIKHLEGAIRKAIDFGDGHAWWNGEGSPFIETGGYNLLKETLEEK